MTAPTPTPQPVIDWVYAIVEVLDRIFDTAGIAYCAMDGTLLGAVRHGGLVPWDDDADLFVPRADADRLYAARERLAPAGLGMAAWWYGYKVFPLRGAPWAGDRESPALYPSVDLWPVVREGSRLVPTSRRARRTWPAEYLTASEWEGRRRVPFADFSLVAPGPDDRPRILDRLYGPDWRTTVYQVWDHVNDTPADPVRTPLPSAEPAERRSRPIGEGHLHTLAERIFPS